MNCTILIEHDDDAEFFEQCMVRKNIHFEYEVIGDKYLYYEFTISIEDEKAVELIIATNNITILNFKSN